MKFLREDENMLSRLTSLTGVLLSFSVLQMTNKRK
jgi:hypothetical protein